MDFNSGSMARSMMNLIEGMKKVAKNSLQYNLKSFQAEDIVKIINTHALGAAASSLCIALFPGASTVATIAAAGFIWSMYFRINDTIGLKISKTILKALASAVLSNLVQAALSIVGLIVVSTALSFTGVGNEVSAIIMAAVDYAIVIVGGIIYIKLLTNLFLAGKRPEEMSEHDLKDFARKIIEKENVKDMLKKATKFYRKGRKDGTITGKELVVLEKDDTEK